MAFLFNCPQWNVAAVNWDAAGWTWAEVGNLGQRQKAATKGQIDLGFLAANCFTAIALAEQLTFALKS